MNGENQEDNTERYKSGRKVRPVAAGNKTGCHSDDGEKPHRLPKAVQGSDMVLAHIKIFASGDEQETLKRFFVLEELAALRTAIRIWGECCQTFGAKRDHSAGRGYRAVLFCSSAGSTAFNFLLSRARRGLSTIAFGFHYRV